MRLSKFLFAAVLSFGLVGCAPGQLSNVLSGGVVSATTATPQQAKSVAEATLAVTLAERALTLYVEHGNPDPAVLRQLKVLVPAVHNALKRVQVANAAGNSALYAAALGAFNEAWAALQAYQKMKGLPQ